MRHALCAYGIAVLACGWGLAACDSESPDSGWWGKEPADAGADRDAGYAGAGGSGGSDAGPEAGGKDAAGGDAGAGGAATGGAAGAPQGGAGGAGGAGGSEQGGAGGSEPGGSGGSEQGGTGGGEQGGFGGDCSFPQGVPDEDFIEAAASYQDTDPSVDAAVNAVMVALSGCGAGSDCTITGMAGTTVEEICQSWFDAVNAKLREQGYCAGQHAQGVTDEIAVSNTGCTGRWYGYHICNYGGGKVVWNPGARRGWWRIEPSHCQ